LEQKAKRHLEEEFRSDIEEKEHIIEALKTKVCTTSRTVEVFGCRLRCLTNPLSQGNVTLKNDVRHFLSLALVT
jgi:hypothetical protein